MKRIAALLVLVCAGLFTIGGCDKPAEKKKDPAPAQDATPPADTTPPAETTPPADAK